MTKKALKKAVKKAVKKKEENTYSKGGGGYNNFRGGRYGRGGGYNRSYGRRWY